MLEAIDRLREDSGVDLAAVADAAGLEAYRIKYLGSKGALKALMSQIKDVPQADKREFGRRANALRQELESGFETAIQRVGDASKAAGAGEASAPESGGGGRGRGGGQGVAWRGGVAADRCDAAGDGPPPGATACDYSNR